MTLKIAITGGIGSGKSAALACIREMGYTAFSCDEIYKEIILTPAYVQKVQAIFPSCVMDGKINRKLLSDIVFSDEKSREKLNSIAHPMIMERLELLMNTCENSLVFAEVPLLFEGGYDEQFDKIIVIVRDYEARLQDVMRRDGVNKASVIKRMQAQFSYEVNDCRMQKSNVVVVGNDKTLIDLKEELKKIIANWQT